jgi:hypothetical protein
LRLGRDFVGDDGADPELGFNEDAAIYFEPGFYAIQYMEGAYRAHVNIDGVDTLRWFTDGFVMQIVDGHGNTIRTRNFPDGCAGAFCPVDANDPQGQATHALAQTSAGNPSLVFKLDHRAKIYLKYFGTNPSFDGTGSVIRSALDTDDPITHPPPQWRIRCVQCREIEENFINEPPNRPDLVCPLRVYMKIEGATGSWASFNGVIPLLLGSGGYANEISVGEDSTLTGPTPQCLSQWDFRPEQSGISFAYSSDNVSPGVCVCPPRGIYTKTGTFAPDEMPGTVAVAYTPDDPLLT